jgi:ABC-type glycerol-3-phosphate transport system substrate-binding protein
MELCERLGVSRTPIRQALSNLVAQGLLVRQAGRGTFVAKGPPEPSGAATTEEISITVAEERWCWPIQQAARIWNEEHPSHQVRIRFQMVGQTELRERLMHSVAKGTATDIALLDSAWVAEFAGRGYLHSFASISPAVTNALTADLVPPLLAENSVRGELYAMPADADFALLWYRKDWFDAEELSPPGTWDELVRCARHFQRASVRDRYELGLYPLTFAGGAEAGETTAYQLLPILWSAGADVIANHQVVLNSPAARNAVTFVANLVRRHGIASRNVASSSWNGPALAFAAGSVAMALGGSYEGALIRAAAGWDETEFLRRVGFVPVPAGPNGEQATVLGGLSYAIFRQSFQPARALELLERASRPEVLRTFCVRTGQNPPTISASQALMAETEPFLHATAQLFRFARPRWPIAEYARVSVQLARMFESVILGESEPDEAVARASAVIAGITGLPERGRRQVAWRSAAVRERR